MVNVVYVDDVEYIWGMHSLRSARTQYFWWWQNLFKVLKSTMCLAKNNSIFSDTFHRSTFFFAFLFSTLLFSFSSSVINSSAFLFISCKTIFYGNHSTRFDWVTRKIWKVFILVSIIQTYRPWTPRRTSERIVNKKIWRESEAYRNFGKWIDWSLAIKRHIVMAAPIVETIWLVNGF